MSVRIKTKLLCKQNFTGRCQTSGCWHWSLHRKEAQCSLFIFVGWQSAWLSNNGKSPCPWEIIIKQRTTHWAQCVECMNAGEEQVCSAHLTFSVMSTQQKKQGFSEWYDDIMYFNWVSCYVPGNSLVTIVLSRLLCMCILYFLSLCLSLCPSFSFCINLSPI